MEITYTVAQSSLGPVLVAATGRGICAIEFGASEEQLTGLLFKRFPKAAIRKGKGDFASGVERVLSLIDTPDQGLDLPLDIQGTAFQRRVLESASADTSRPNRDLCRSGRNDRPAQGRPGRGQCLCLESDRHCRTLPPGCQKQWKNRRIPLGNRSERSDPQAGRKEVII